MTFLITNDDGIDAPGLKALRQAVDGQGVIVAPLQHHSGCSHQVTTHRPISVEQRSPTEYGVEGTPVDCVRMAVSQLHPSSTWVLSGINAGGNLGADVYISGTVAAVREAALYRIPGIAISHYIYQRRPIDWARAAVLATQVIQKLLQCSIQPGSFWNVNLPHLDSDAPDPDIVFCPLCTQPLPAVYRSVELGLWEYAGEYGKRSRDLGSDVEVCFSGNIAVTQLWICGQPEGTSDLAQF